MAAEDLAADPAPPRGDAWLLIACIFAAAVAGLVYELVAGTLSSYLLGDSITQFSMVIGIFLTAMGIGSWYSERIEGDLPTWFVAVETATGLAGGVTAPLAFAAFTFTQSYIPILVLLVGIVGTLVGLEIPLMIRILREREGLEAALARVLAADYLGALFASLLFPFVLLPHLGLMRAGLAMGLLNVLVAGVTLRVFGDELGPARRKLRLAVAASTLVLGAGFVSAGWMVGFMESQLYQDEIILARDTPFQRVVLTRWRDDVRLFLNGHLQFSSVDEYRYHETLVHPAMSLAERRETVLILGGGDGLAARRVLEHPGVARVDLVDIDAFVTELFTRRDGLAALGAFALRDPRVHVHNQDALRYLEETDRLYDVVIMDLPDPSSPGIAKLYSRSFFNLVGRRLARGGVLVTQATSPFRSREAFWCIAHTLEAARMHGSQGPHFRTRAIQTVVPTFGTWGFVLAAEREPDPARIRLPPGTRYLTPELVPGLFEFPADMAEVPTGVSQLDDALVSTLYLRGYHRYLE